MVPVLLSSLTEGDLLIKDVGKLACQKWLFKLVGFFLGYTWLPVRFLLLKNSKYPFHLCLLGYCSLPPITLTNVALGLGLFSLLLHLARDFEILAGH